jgi:Uma2 family endonuclease
MTMSTAAPQKRYTPEDLLRMPDGNRYELVDGDLVELDMSTWSSYVAGMAYVKVHAHAEANRLGWVFPEGTSYQSFPTAPGRVRRLDGSFIRADRLSVAQAAQEGHLTIIPDLAIEVISPNDLGYEIDAKVQECLTAGVRLVWVIYPESRTVCVYRPDEPGTILRENDVLDGEDVLPGFRCRVGDLFVPPAGTAAAP